MRRGNVTHLRFQFKPHKRKCKHYNLLPKHTSTSEQPRENSFVAFNLMDFPILCVLDVQSCEKCHPIPYQTHIHHPVYAFAIQLR